MADLNGMWLGTYWQAGQPTRFEATLIQAHNSLTGRILDDGDLGEAQMSGEVVGRNITFTKHYLTGSQTPIHYVGIVSEDGNHIQGEWSINLTASGTWEAHRSVDDLTAELQKLLSKSLAGSVS